MSQSNLDLRFNEIKNPVFNNAGFLLWVNSQLKTTKQVLVTNDYRDAKSSDHNTQKESF
jgi:hypothetical protein